MARPLFNAYDAVRTRHHAVTTFLVESRLACTLVGHLLFISEYQVYSSNGIGEDERTS